MSGSSEILIRHAEPEDYEAIAEILSGTKAVWGTMQLPFPSAEQWRKRLAEPPPGLFVLVASVDGTVVGQLGLHTYPNRPRRRHAGGIGMAVHDEWHGKGVGTALLGAAIDMADRWLNLRRLELEVYTDNETAIELYRKAGFAVEGRLVDFGYRDGSYVDAYLMARIRR